MKSLFLHKNEVPTLVHAFRDGSLVSCSFVNGWPCRVCGGMTEHTKIDGAQVCLKCKTAYVPSVPIQVIEYKQFYNSLRHYVEKIEFEAVKDEMYGNGKCSLDWYVQARMQLSSNKILEEVIANAKY